MDTCFAPADILLPADDETARFWPVVACDQFTSQREYWQELEKLVGDRPSALNIVFPEVYLDEGYGRIESIQRHIRDYLSRGVLTERVHEGFVLVERSTRSGVRIGLVGKVDLDCYDYTPESKALIRATEGTVISRIPPRVKIRQGAEVESPHVMLLCDDRERELIEPLYARRKELPKLYDLELLMGGGHLRGYAVTGELAKKTQDIIARQQSRSDLYLAVGDGNHSLATAKTCWEQIRPGLTEAERKSHPARYALAELVNLHCEALNFVPIHRVLFNVDAGKLIDDFTSAVPWAEGEDIVFIHKGGRRGVKLTAAGDRLPVDVLQTFLDRWLEAHPETEIDYVHGSAALEELSVKDGNCGMALKAMDKNALFPAIIAGGVLPRKTFSMGEAEEKRYYMECRKIR
ncbi:MAG: DUF1015 domain-containing protein [Oscillospiraceae bacterium]